jgi:ABC-type Na+ efflux pump permease subunit
MSKKFSILFTFFSLFVLAALSVVIVTQAQKTTPQKTTGKRVDNIAVTQTKESQKAMTPARALQLLKDGNERFVSGGMVNRDLRAQIKATS